MNLIVIIFIRAVLILVIATLLPGVAITGLFSAILVAIVLSILNAFLKPLLVILTLPVNILTLGLFMFIINAVLVMLASTIVPGFRVDSFWWALGFSLILSFVTSWF
ncbi:MAG TPA: phage holin family protein [Candidatus Paceibacterota bacterium]